MELTGDFSICLICDAKSAALVNRAREVVPNSKQRDDRPHMTLLRELKGPAGLSDEELLKRLSNLTNYSSMVSQKVRSCRPMVWQGFYGWSTVMPVRTTKELRAQRRELLRNVLGEGFGCATLDKYVFIPHITVRLGAYAGRRQRAEIRTLIPPGTEFGFDSVVIFRTLQEGGRRLIREVPLT
jgi:2'-5' RNA ligase